jgi:hypothetical protein
MDSRCYVCERREEVVFNLFPDLCDSCARYDWGRWHIERVIYWGFFIGAVLAFIWVMGGHADAYRYPAAAIIFAVVVGGVLGAAIADAVGSFLFDRYLLSVASDLEEHQKAQEAEKFFYVGLLSAFQGKTNYALRMMRQARRHGWHRWGRMTNDPRFRDFCQLSEVKHLMNRS